MSARLVKGDPCIHLRCIRRFAGSSLVVCFGAAALVWAGGGPHKEEEEEKEGMSTRDEKEEEKSGCWLPCWRLGEGLLAVNTSRAGRLVGGDGHNSHLSLLAGYG